jgi:RNA polymerase sigma factor (sigma-70 family)
MKERGPSHSSLYWGEAVVDEQPKTRPSLLARLRDVRNGDAWSEFVAIYSPLVYRYSRRRGLQSTDAADVTQDVFRAVARSMERFEYDPSRGRFRAWLITVTRSKLRDLLARRERESQGVGGTAAQERLDAVASSDQEEAFVEGEYQRCLFDWAATEVRAEFEETSWQAFWQTNVEGKSTQEVAASLGISVGAVYIARSRVLARLRQKISQVED